MLSKNNNTHIAHGLKPSTKPITVAINGNDTLAALILPIIGTTNVPSSISIASISIFSILSLIIDETVSGSPTSRYELIVFSIAYPTFSL